MFYIAYGSNMNLEQMEQRCPNSYVVKTAWIKGWELVFNVHADIIESNKDSFVPVVIWDVPEEDMKSLDVYEGYPGYYDKHTISFTDDDGNIGTGIVYVMQGDRKGICPPDRHYFDGIVRGCIENEIDIAYLYDALDYSYEHRD